MPDIKAEMEKIRQEGRERVAATGQTLCIFADNVPANIAEDILAGMRLMTEMANKQFDKETQQREWYNFYNNGLMKFGWTLTGNAHAEEALDEASEVTLAQLIEKVVTISVNRCPRRSASASRVMKLVVEKREVQTHLERTSTSDSGKSSHFVIAQCEMTPQGLPAMHMTSFQATYDHKIDSNGALNRKIDLSSTRVYRASQQGTFSVRHFDAARKVVDAKLANDIADFLAF